MVLGTLVLEVEVPVRFSVVDVAVSGASWSGTVNAPGRYSFTVPPGTYTVGARAVVYQGVRYEPLPDTQVVSVSGNGVGEALVRYVPSVVASVPIVGNLAVQSGACRRSLGRFAGAFSYGPRAAGRCFGLADLGRFTQNGGGEVSVW